MRRDTLAILRCPYCGGGLEPLLDRPLREEGGELLDGALACHCCLFPVVDGIPVLHLRPEAEAALQALEAGDFHAAARAMVDVEDPERASGFLAAAAAPDATYRGLVESLGEAFEGGYFLYRFTDPSYVVASAVVGAVASEALAGGGRALDVCGGSGHLTRLFLGRGGPPPVVADLYFSKLWLARRFVAPGSEAVCCDADAPLPFARGAFSLALCADAFMFVWTKRQLVAEMTRVVDGEESGAVVLTHAHNALVWSPSHGQPLPPRGYKDLFEGPPPRLYPEGALLDDVVAGGPLDLARPEDEAALDADPALVVVAGPASLYRPHTLAAPPAAPSEIAVNPLYRGESREGGLALRLHFPDEHYEEEFGDCRRYLEEEVLVAEATLAAARRGERTAEVEDLLARRVLLELPPGYA